MAQSKGLLMMPLTSEVKRDLPGEPHWHSHSHWHSYVIYWHFVAFSKKSAPHPGRPARPARPARHILPEQPANISISRPLINGPQQVREPINAGPIPVADVCVCVRSTSSRDFLRYPIYLWEFQRTMRHVAVPPLAPAPNLHNAP